MESQQPDQARGSEPAIGSRMRTRPGSPRRRDDQRSAPQQSGEGVASVSGSHPNLWEGGQGES